MVTEVLRPGTVEEALRMGERPAAAFLGGGTWLNSGRAPGVGILVSLERLGLGGIEREGDGVRIGAGASLQKMLGSEALPAGLRAAAALTASRTLRVMATLGGELGLLPADSALIPVLTALDAVVHLAGAAKPVGVRDFRAARPRGLILGVSLPGLRPCAVEAVSRTSHSPRSLVVAAALGGGGLRIVVSDCEGQLVEAPDAASVTRLFAPRAGIHATAAYKAYMARTLAEELAARLSGGGSLA
jgi:probable selenate reductase FAD-binding subunit